MDIVTSYEQGRAPVTVFHIGGEINAESYPQLQSAAEQAFHAGTRNLLLDLSEVPYITSAGLRTIHQIFSMLHAESSGESDADIRQGIRDGTFVSPHLKLLNPQPIVTTVLHTAGFDMYIEIHHNLKDALASF
jgi:anti-anti-sigma regulatory factor